MKYDIDDIQKRKELHARIRKLVYIFLVIILYNIVLLYMSYIDKFDTPSFYIYKAYVITTNSMEPTINVGDIIIVSGIEKDKIKTDKIGRQLKTRRYNHIQAKWRNNNSQNRSNRRYRRWQTIYNQRG